MDVRIASLDRDYLIEGFVAAAVEAGGVIMEIYKAGFEVRVKGDASPVTEADAAAEAIILKALKALAPQVPVVAEEEAAAGRIPDVADAFFIVDPLDGTKEFIERRGDFTVNIALVEHGSPTLGVVFAPARDELFAGDLQRNIAWKSNAQARMRGHIRVREPGQDIVAVASKSHNTPETDRYLARYAVRERVSIGSSLKFCLVASGVADLYPRLAPTCEWDTAAGHAVLCAAGGSVCALDGQPLRYGKPKFFNPGFIAAGLVDVLVPEPA